MTQEDLSGLSQESIDAVRTAIEGIPPSTTLGNIYDAFVRHPNEKIYPNREPAMLLPHSVDPEVEREALRNLGRAVRKNLSGNTRRAATGAIQAAKTNISRNSAGNVPRLSDLQDAIEHQNLNYDIRVRRFAILDAFFGRRPSSKP